LYYYLIADVAIKYNLKFICYPILELGDVFRSYSIIFSSFNPITVNGGFITTCCCVLVFVNVLSETTLSPEHLNRRFNRFVLGYRSQYSYQLRADFFRFSIPPGTAAVA